LGFLKIAPIIIDSHALAQPNLQRVRADSSRMKYIVSHPRKLNIPAGILIELNTISDTYRGTKMKRALLLFVAMAAMTAVSASEQEHSYQSDFPLDPSASGT
jgi:hypothetical protein